MALLLFALLTILLPPPAIAQTGTCTQLGGGFTSCSDNTGRQATIIDMGGGFRSYSDNKGNSGSIVDLGGGFSQFNITPGKTVPPPPVFSPRSQPGFPPTPGFAPMPAMPSMPGVPPTPAAPPSPMMSDPFGMR